MTDRVNPAARIEAVLARIRAMKPAGNSRCSEVWAAALDVEIEPSAPRRPVEISRRLLALYEQVDLVRSLVPSRTQLSHSIYAEDLDELQLAFNPHLLHQHWANAESHLGEGVFKTVRFLADLLGDTEAGISHDTLAELLVMVTEIEETMQGDDSLSPELRRFILRTLAAVRAAIQEYGIRGADGLRYAAQLLTIGLADFAPVVDAKDRSKTVKRLLALGAALVLAVNQGGTFADNLDHLQKAAAAIIKAAPEAAKRLKLGSEPKLLGPGDQPASQSHPDD